MDFKRKLGYSFLFFSIVLLTGYAYATTVSDTGITVALSKLTKETTLTIGFDDSSDYNVANYGGVASSACNSAMNYMNSSGKKGVVFFREGNYYFNGACNITSNGITVEGEGVGTMFINNYSHTANTGALFDLQLYKSQDFTFRNFAAKPGNSSVSLRLLRGGGWNGTDGDQQNFSNNIYVHDISAYDTGRRLIDLNGNNHHVYNVWTNGSRGLYGGRGSDKFIHHNVILGDNSTANEHEGVDINGQAYYNAYIHDNTIINFYEQGVDCGSFHCKVQNNYIQMSVPTYQPCITVQDDSTVSGNTCLFGRNATGTQFGGIESYGLAYNNIISDNIVIGNLTGLTANQQTGMFCLRIGSNQSIISGNHWINCVPYQNTSGNMIARNNLFMGNVYTNLTGVLEFGINATVNDYDSTSNTWIQQSPSYAGTGNAIACFNSNGRMYRGNATGCP